MPDVTRSESPENAETNRPPNAVRCEHGGDDPAWCWGCLGVPSAPTRPRYAVMATPDFIEQARALGARYPLRAVSGG